MPFDVLKLDNIVIDNLGFDNVEFDEIGFHAKKILCKFLTNMESRSKFPQLKLWLMRDSIN
jgi:hypothetical protein